MSKTRIFGILMALVLLVGMVSPVGAEENITIKVAWANMEPGTYDAWMDYFFNPYMKQNPNVTIDFVSQASIQDTVRVQIGVGAGPDIFMADCFDVPSYAESGRIIDLDEYAEQYKWNDLFHEWALNSAKFDGSLYGIPYSADVTGMYYNADMLKELGLEVPTNREEYVACCQAALDNGYVAIGFGYSDAALFCQWIYDHYMTCYLGKEGIEKLFTGELKFSDPEVAGVVEMLKADWDAGFINDKLSSAITGDEGRAIFTTGRAMFNPEGNWMSIQRVPPNEIPFDWNFTVWPSMKEGIPSAGCTGLGDMFCVNAATEHPDVCMDLLNFMFSDKERLAGGVANGMTIPCVSLSDEDFPEGTPDAVTETVRSSAEIASTESVSYCPWSGYPADTNIWMYENIAKLWYDEMTVEEYIQGAQEVLDKDLAEGFTFVAY